MKAVLLTLVLASMLVPSVQAAPLVNPSQVQIDGMTLTFPDTDQTLTIAPLTVKHHEMTATLKTVTPTWRQGLYLPGTSWRFRTLRRGSLVVTLADRPDVTLTEGEDYAVDWDWGTVGAIAGGQITPKTKVKLAYDYTATRLDLIQRGPDGRYSVVTGKEDSRQPVLSDPAEGHTAVMSVYLPANTTALTKMNLNFIDPACTGIPPVTGAETLDGVKKKLDGREPLTIVFFGDSITAQKPRDFRDGKGSFVDRFRTYLQQRHADREVIPTNRTEVVKPTGSQIVVAKCGQGGDNTNGALKRLDAEVLAHKPDLVIILFGANDENRRGTTDRNMVPPARYEANLTTIVRRCRQAGAAVILLTPAMKNRGWSSTVGNMADYAAAVRRVGAAGGACVVDSYQMWEDLPKLGYNYMIPLGTCINHPVDMGHEIFFEGLKAAVE
ncbi:MAG: SGNH/GDSL hydrolase family protein [Planctomycetota bacterium]